MNERKTKITKILRSLIISSTQEGVCMQQLINDYKKFEGSELPLFEYKTADEFFRHSDEFVVDKVHGQFIIYAKTTAESAHISKLVSEQNRARGRKSNQNRHSVRKPPQQPIRTSRTFFRSKSIVEHSPRIGLNISVHQSRHQSSRTVEFSFDQLQSQQKKTDGERQLRKAPTIEFSFEQLALQHAKNDYGKNWFANDEITEIKKNNEAEAFAEDVIDYRQMDQLELPWEDEYWSLFVTCCTSVTKIWGKLFGKHCNLDTSATRFQDDLLKNKKTAVDFNVGRMYLTVIFGFGYRVRLDDVDHSKDQMLCFFVDEGDQRWLHMNDIYNCRSKFMKYPPQAICFALHGLKDFHINSDTARTHLENTFLNRPLTGQIFTTKEVFISHNETNGSDTVILVAFHEPSSTSDNFVNLHPKILKQIYGDDVTVPDVAPFKLTPVNISFVGENGDIFFRLQRNDLQHVNKLIKEFVREAMNNRDLTPEETETTSSENLFVVFDEETKRLYRAKSVHELKDGKVMYFIDHGNVKTIALSRMYRVASSNREIFKIPPQAIRTKLNGMSKVPESLVARLRCQFTANKSAYVKRMQSNTIVPEVKLYFEANSFLVCVNDSFGLESERNEIIDATGDTATQDDSLDNVYDDDLSTTIPPTMPTITKIKTFRPPKLSSCFEIVIERTETPSNFVIRPIKYMAQWHEQMKALQHHCKTSSATMPLEMIKEDEPYACLKSNGYWYRAFIKIHRSKIYAFFCDVADIDNIDDVKKIKFLPEEYRIIPKLAMNASLFGIEPANAVWEMDDNIRFNQITKGLKFQAIVQKVIEEKNNNAMLEVTLFHNSFCINDSFVESGRAIMSKYN